MLKTKKNVKEQKADTNELDTKPKDTYKPPEINKTTQEVNKFLNKQLAEIQKDLEDEDKLFLKKIKVEFTETEEKSKDFVEYDHLDSNKVNHLLKQVDPNDLKLVHELCQEVETEIFDDIQNIHKADIIREPIRDLNATINHEIDFEDKKQFLEVMTLGYAPDKRPSIIQAKKLRENLRQNYSCTTQQFQLKQPIIAEEISNFRAEHNKLVNKFRISYKKAAERATKAVQNEKDIQEQKFREIQEKHKQMALENMDKLQKVKQERDKALQEWNETHKPKSATQMPHNRFKKSYEKNQNIFFKQQQEKKAKLMEKIPYDSIKNHMLTVTKAKLQDEMKSKELAKRYPNLSMDPKTFKESLKKESVKKVHLDYIQRQENVKHLNDQVRSTLQNTDNIEQISTLPKTSAQKRTIFFEKLTEKANENNIKIKNYIHSGYMQRNEAYRNETHQSQKLIPRESLIAQMAQKNNRPASPKPIMPNYIADARKNNIIPQSGSLTFLTKNPSKANMYDNIMAKSEQFKKAGDQFTKQNRLKADPNVKSNLLTCEEKKKSVRENADQLYWKSIEARMMLLDQFEDRM